MQHTQNPHIDPTWDGDMTEFYNLYSPIHYIPQPNGIILEAYVDTGTVNVLTPAVPPCS